MKSQNHLVSGPKKKKITHYPQNQQIHIIIENQELASCTPMPFLFIGTSRWQENLRSSNQCNGMKRSLITLEVDIHTVYL